MNSDEVLFLIYGVLIGALLTLLLYYRRYRINKNPVHLTPNCLLTRDPLLLITPPQKLFGQQPAYARIYRILSEHGYQTEWIQLVSNSQLTIKMTAQLEAFESESKKFHFILSENHFNTLRQIQSRRPFNCIKTATLLDFQTGAQALKKAVELAEYEY